MRITAVPDRDDPEAFSLTLDAVVDGDPLTLTLDTGTPRTRLTRQPGAPIATEHTQGVLGAARVGRAVAEVALPGVPGQRLEIETVERDLPGARALLGLDYLSATTFGLSVVRRSLEIGTPPPHGAPVSTHLPSEAPHLLVPLTTAEGSVFAAVFDTGAGITVLDSAFADEHPEWFSDHSSATGTDAAGHQVSTPVAHMHGTAIGDHPLQPHRVAFLDLRAQTAHLRQPLDVILGLPAIAQFDWWFDVEQRTWAVTPPQPET